MIKTDEINKFDQKLGSILRDIREKDIGITQREMAKKIKVTQPTISNTELGNVSASVYLLYKYCEAAGIEPKKAMDRLEKDL